MRSQAIGVPFLLSKMLLMNQKLHCCMLQRALRGTIALLLLAVVTGCSSPTCNFPTHIVIVDKEGILRDRYSGARVTPVSTKKGKKGKQPGAREYRERLPNNLKQAGKPTEYFGDIWDDIEKQGHTNIVIFIQGGLNSEKNGIERANETTEEILKDSAYPIFIAWNANLGSAYWEHLVLVHRGKTDPATAIPLSPLTLLADLGRLISRAPISLLEQTWAGVRTWQTKEYASDCTRTGSQQSGKLFPEPEVNNAFCWLQTNNVNIALGTNSPRASFKVRGVAQTLKSFPNAFSEAVIDTGGKLGWDQMLRRTKTMFTTANTFEKGGFEIFSEELCGYLKNHPEQQVILVGHSMGSIVATEMVRRHGDELNLSHIVFLAAACGTEDFFRGVVPFLTTHTNVQFYNLCLNPANDAAESYYYFGRHNPLYTPVGLIAPDGSLLDWIDYYYSSTETDFGRTLGKWENAVLGMKGIIDQGGLARRLPNQISIKGLGVGPHLSYGPQHHGDLGNIRFWDLRTWEPGKWDESMWDVERLKTQ